MSTHWRRHGVPHTYRAGDEGAVALVTSAPGGFVAFLREAGTPAARAELPVLDGPPDVERLARIAGAHGITLLGPPGMLPSGELASLARVGSSSGTRSSSRASGRPTTLR